MTRSSLCLVLALGAVLAGTAARANSGEIVVTAGKLTDFEEALRRCIESNCPPDAEIAASVRLAEAHFRSGDYRQAGTTLERTISRTKNEAARVPDAVAALYEARSTVARHYGNQADALGSAYRSFRVGNGDYNAKPSTHIVSRLKLIDLLVEQGRFEDARHQIRSAKTDAKQLGLGDFAIALEVRSAMIDVAFGNAKKALRDLQALVARPDAQSSPALYAALGTAAQIANKLGDTDAETSLRTAMATNSPRPVLVVRPKDIQPPNARFLAQDQGVAGVSPVRSSDSTGLRWIDVGFIIGADGRPENVEIRDSSRGDPKWARSIVEAITARRYAPPGQDPPYSLDRLERYTLTADFVKPIGSLVTRRAGKARVRMLDLTVEPVAVAAR